MAITVITSPENFQYSKNKIPFVLQTDQQTAGLGNQHIILNFVGTAVDGSYFSIFGNNGKSYTCTAKNDPGTDGTEVPVKGALSNYDYIALAVTYIRKNKFINDNFHVSAGPIITDGLYTLRFTSKEIGVNPFGSAISQSYSFGFFHTFSFSAAVEPIYPENYKAIARVLVIENYADKSVPGFFSYEISDPDYGAECDIQLEADLFNSIARFELSKIIDAYLNYTLPSYNTQDVAIALNSIKYVMVKYYESYGNPAGIDEIHETALFPVLKAGIKEGAFNQSGVDIFDKYLNPTLFLTRQPRGKKVAEKQQEYLYMLHKCSYSYGLKVKATIYFKNGSPSVVFLGDNFPLDEVIIKGFPGAPTDYNIRDFSMYVVPVGFAQLALAYNFDDVLKYTIEIIRTDTSATISELFTYITDNNNYVDETIIYFTNSDGGFDTVRFTGSLEQGFDVAFDTIETVRLFDTPVINGATNGVNYNKTDKAIINSGWLTKTEADWLEDLFVAEQKFVDYNGHFMPIVITTNSVKKYDSQTGKTAFQIEYYHSIANTVI